VVAKLDQEARQALSAAADQWPASTER